MTIDLAQRLTDATTGTLELFSVHLGRELGLYDVLDRQGPATAAQLAVRAGIDERYALEWLEQQAVSGFLDVVAGDAAITRCFALPPAHRGPLVDPIDGEHVAPFAGMVVGVAQALDEVVAAFRTGAGVPYARYGAAFRHGQGGINRPAFSSDLVKVWLPAVEGLDERLDGGTVLDIGTGHGWSAIAVQAAWPSARVVGLDTDEASIEEARAHAAQAGVEVAFELVPDGTAPDLGVHGPVDAALILETLHDMAQPAAVLRAVRAALTPGGVVVVADEAVAHEFTSPGDDLERMMFGWSVTHCLPASRAEDPSAAIGTAIRPATVAQLATEAGFASCEVVDVDAGFFRLYRLAA